MISPYSVFFVFLLDFFFEFVIDYISFEQFFIIHTTQNRFTDNPIEGRIYLSKLSLRCKYPRTLCGD